MTDVVRDALEVMGKGMLAVFVVILILTLIVYLLSKITSKNKPESEE